MRHDRMGRRIAGLVMCGVALSALPSTVWPNDALANLTCVDIDALIAEGKSWPNGLSRDEFRDALLVAVRAKMPRLQVGTDCKNLLSLAVNLSKATTEQGADVGYYGAIGLEAMREAIIRVTGEFYRLPVWRFDLLVRGRLGEARSDVLRRIDDLITRFAADYYKAGNP